MALNAAVRRARTAVLSVDPVSGSLNARFRHETRTITGPVAAELRVGMGAGRYGALHFYDERPAGLRCRLIVIGIEGGGMWVADRDTPPVLATAPLCAAFAAWLGLAPGDARYVTLEATTT